MKYIFINNHLNLITLAPWQVDVYSYPWDRMSRVMGKAKKPNCS